MLFVIFDMKLLFLVWRSHYMRQIDNPQALRKKLTTFYVKFCINWKLFRCRTFRISNSNVFLLLWCLADRYSKSSHAPSNYSYCKDRDKSWFWANLRDWILRGEILNASVLACLPKQSFFAHSHIWISYCINVNLYFTSNWT